MGGLANAGRGYYLFAAVALAFTLNVGPVVCWESYEFQLFDLMEEVKQNFYDFIGVAKDASASDIKKAYRKLSLKWHPDKRKEPDAEVLFRQLVAVNEVLQDDIQRRRYDELLITGLPDWRQPVFYYRRVRKLGLAELAALVLVAVSCIHYAMMWAAYWEKMYDIEERWMSRLKRSHKKKSADVAEGEFIDLKKSISRPSWPDILLCRLVMAAGSASLQMPSLCMVVLNYVKGLMAPVGQPTSTADDTAAAETVTAQRSSVAPTSLRVEPVMSNVRPVVYTSPLAAAATSAQGLQPPSDAEDTSQCKQWTDAEVSMLVKATVKYPVGSFERWEKIAAMLGRPVSSVTAKVKELKAHNFHGTSAESGGGALVRGLKKQLRTIEPEPSGDGGDGAEVGLQPAELGPLSAALAGGGGVPPLPEPAVSERCDPGSTLTSAPGSAVTGDCSKDTASSLSSSSWSQQQQRLLESALAAVPRSLPERWDRIAELVPGKSKTDCMLRCKQLADKVRSRRQQPPLASS